jgi:hypothetical protein
MIYSRNTDKCCLQFIIDATGCSKTTARARLILWQDHRLDTDDLFRPAPWPKTSTHLMRSTVDTTKGDWGKLSNRSRVRNLEKIKVGKYDYL